MKKTLWKLGVCLIACIGALMLVLAIASCSDDDKPADKSNTVTFETYGGSEVGSIGINAGDKISAPAAPTKSAATFVGWYLDEDFEDEFPFETALEGKNYTAYARWNVTITYEVNGGTAIAPVHKDAKDMLILPTPTADGKMFYGWFSDAAMTQQVNRMYTVPNDSVTLYAKWGKLDDGTAIDLMDGFTVNEANSYNMENVADGVKFTTLRGKGEWAYVYSDLTTDLTGYSVIRFAFTGTKDRSMIVKLQFGGVDAIEQKYVFTGEYQEEFWSIPAGNIGTNTSATDCQKLIIFIDPNINGATTSGTELTFESVEFCKMVGENEAGQNVLVFNTMGGSFVNALYGAEGSALTLPTNPTKAGYTFAGWYSDKNCTEAFTATKMPKGPTIVYAKWEEATAYTVSFVTNCDLTVDPVDVRPGLKIEAPALKVAGWTFVGWCSDAALTQLSDLIMPESNTTLYAKWLKLADLSDRENAYDITTGWTKDNENNGYTITDADGEMTLTMNNKGTWNGIERDISGLDRTYINALHIVLDAVEGHSFTIFLKDASGKYIQREIQITSAHFDEWIYLEESLADRVTLKINYQNGKTVENGLTVKFSKIELLNPIEKIDTFDISDGWKANQEGHYTVTEGAEGATITVNTVKTAWSYLLYDWSELNVDFPNTREINAVINGAAGHTVMFKYNNKVEKSVVLDGTDQEVKITLTEPLNGAVNCLIIFVDGIVNLPEEAFDVTIKSITLSVYHDETVYGDKEIDLIDGTFTAFNPGTYTSEKTADGLVITANSTKTLWDPINLSLSEFDVDKAFEIRLTVVGPAGHKLSFKYNNDNSLQTHVDLTGEEQDIVIKVSNINKDIALNIFIDVGVNGTEDVSVTVKSFKLVVKAPVDEING